MKKSFAYFFVFLAFSIVGKSQIPQAELDALMELYIKTGGSEWDINTNWNTAMPASTWHGVTVVSDHVRAIHLSDNGLSGIIPASITALSFLEELDISFNDVYNIPSDINTALMFSFLDVSNNRLTFKDLIPLIDADPNLTYAPQQSLGLITNYVKKGSSHNLFLIDENIDGVKYEWFFDSIFSIGPPSPDPSIMLANVSDLDVSVYRLVMTHDDYPNLQLEGWLNLDLLCVDSSGGCYVCNEFIVQFDDPTKIQEVKDSFTEHVECIKYCKWEKDLVLFKVVDVFSETVIKGQRQIAEEVADTDSTSFNYVSSVQPDTFNFEEGNLTNYNQIPVDNLLNPVSIAILDTGFDGAHCQLESFKWNNPLEEVNGIDDDASCLVDDLYGYDFKNNTVNIVDTDGHGTHVAGIISSGNPDAPFKMMDMKFAQDAQGNLFDALCAMYYAMAEEDVDVINCSWGFYTDTIPILLRNALVRARDYEIVVVASGGNGDEVGDGIDTDVKLHWPSGFTREFDNLISVGAYVTEGSMPDRIAPFSNFGAMSVDLLAPGTRIESTFPFPLDENDGVVDGLRELSGTSMAAGFVSKTAAVIRSNNPSKTAAEVVECILCSVDTSVPGLDGKVYTNGVLDHFAAVDCQVGNCIVDNTQEILQERLLVYPQPFVDVVYFDVSEFNGAAINLSVYDLTGRLIFNNQFSGDSIIAWNNGNTIIPGFYFYLMEVDEQLYSGKLIKQ